MNIEGHELMPTNAKMHQLPASVREPEPRDVYDRQRAISATGAFGRVPYAPAGAMEVL